MDETIQPRFVKIAALALAACAILGVYQGVKRSFEPDAVGVELGPVGAPVPGARQASPLTEPPPSLLTEAQVREIARQEARNALNRPAPAPTQEAGDEAAAPARPLAPPAPITPPPPPPAPAEQAPADVPLF